jgi:sulfur-carrier protein
MIRVVLPAHLRTLARVTGEVQLEIEGQPTLQSVLTAIESRYPALQGTIRDQSTHQRRPFIRFFACQEDLSHDPANTVLPPEVLCGEEPFLIVGAMAGG